MGEADFSGKMVVTTKGISLMVNSQALAFITLQILIKHTQENLGIAIWRAKEKKLGQMVVNMKEISRMERRMEKEFLSGLME